MEKKLHLLLLSHITPQFCDPGSFRCGWTQGVQAKLWDPLRTRAIPEHLRGVFTTRRYTNLPLPYLTYLTFTSSHRTSSELDTWRQC